MPRSPRVRVDLLNISLDGYAAGDEISLERPMGGAQQLFRSFDGRVIGGVQGADVPITADKLFTSVWGQGVGVEIMGRGKFGPQKGPWPDDGWRGWWEEEPPFQTPVVVLTHHEHEPLHFENGTSFHFLDAAPQQALEYAQQLAQGGDIRLGGGPSSVREFLAEDLVDFMHLTIVPIVLGTGVSLWEGLGGIEDRFDIESISTGQGVVHQFWNRKNRNGQ